MNIEPGKVYTGEELAEVLGLSVRTVQRMAAKGELKARRLGRRRVFIGQEVLDNLPVDVKAPLA